MEAQAGIPVSLQLNRATPAVSAGHYVLSVNSSLVISLKGVAPVTKACTYAISKVTASPGYQLSGTLTQPISVTLAGAVLRLPSVTIGNEGLTIASAYLSPPTKLGSGSVTLTNIRINGQGIYIGDGVFDFPTLGFGNIIKLVETKGRLQVSPDYYYFQLDGTLQVRLPDNSQDITVHLTLENGDLHGTIDQFSLKISVASLSLNGIEFDNDGLYVQEAWLTLSADMGSIGASVYDVHITKDGMTVGGGGGKITLPDFEITGMIYVSGPPTAEFKISADLNHYQIGISGLVTLRFPGVGGAGAGGTIWVDQDGNFDGTLDRFRFELVGFAVETLQTKLNPDGSVYVGEAKMTAVDFGGASITVYGLLLSKDGISMPEFKMPKLSIEGLDIDASGSLERFPGGGYHLACSGKFTCNGIGTDSPCDGIEIAFDLVVAGNGSTVMLIKPAGQEFTLEELQAVANPPVGHSPLDELPASITASSVQSISGTLKIDCTIPIPSTGLAITSLRGGIEISNTTKRFKLGLTIATEKKILGQYPMSADGDVDVTLEPFHMLLKATMKVFWFTVAGATGDFYEDYFVSDIWVNTLISEGSMHFETWGTTGNFHMTGSAALNIGWHKADWWEGCTTWGCCPDGEEYYVFNCWAWEVSKCEACISLPPWDMYFESLAEVGEFSNGVWGFKGKVDFWGSSYGFYIDTSGNLYTQNVDSYTLLTRPTVAEARRQWEEARSQGKASDSLWETPEGTFRFTASDVQVSVPVTVTTGVAFTLGRTGDAPTLSLLTPSGAAITPASLPGNVHYQQAMTYTFPVRPSAPSPAAALSPATLEALRNALPQYSVDRLCQFSAAAAEIMARDASALQALAANAAVPARVRLTQASPDSGPVDVLANGVRIVSGAAYSQTTAYADLAPGVYTLRVVAAGTTSPVLAQTTLTATIGAKYRLVAMGPRASMGLLTLGDLPGFASEGRALLRAVNASPNLPSMDVYVRGTRGTPRVMGGVPFFGGLAFRAAASYDSLDAGTYDVEVRAAGSGTVLASLSGVALSENRVYTVYVMGLNGGAPGLQLAVRMDTAPKVQVRFAHAMLDVGAVDVLLNGTKILTSSVAYSTTPYAAVDAGAYTLTVVPAGASSPLFVNTSVSLATGSDYTLGAVGQPGGIQAMTLADDKSVPEWGKARLRFVHASPNVLGVDVTLDHLRISTNVPYKGAGGYVSATAGAHTLRVYRTGTATLLLTVPVTLSEGNAFTVLMMGLSGGSPALRGVVSLDMTGQPFIQETYYVDGAQTGTWQMVLTGTPGPTDTYVLSSVGSNPAPGVSDLSATLGAPGQVDLGWRITSDEPGTIVNVYATSGPITVTQVISGSGGVTHTVVSDYFSGTLLKANVPTPLDGRVYNTASSLAALESGTYHIWLEADDLRNPPVRVYAPGTVVVDHGASWTSTWTAPLTLTVRYRGFDLAWGSHPHPDVDIYRVYVGMSPLSMTAVLTTSVDGGAAAVLSLEAGQRYYVALAAVDEDDDRISMSQAVSGITLAAPFELTAPAETATVVGGQQTTAVITVSTTLELYPSGVSLPATVSDEGIRLLPQTAIVTPTAAGVAVPVTISTANTIADGTYSIPLVAQGDGVTRTVSIAVRVIEPRFDMAVAPGTVALARGASRVITVTTSAVNGSDRPITLDLRGAPDGLNWALSAVTLMPGGVARLVITDTALLTPGSYTLTVAGDNGVRVEQRTFVVTANKVAFDLVAPSAVMLRPAVERELLVGADGVGSWSGPVTLTIDAATVPPDTTVGFVSGGTIVGQVVVNAGQRVSLRITASETLAPATYILRLDGWSGDAHDLAEIRLVADPKRLWFPVVSVE